MSNIEKAGSGKLAKIVEGIEFENDFGQEILGLGHITQDKGVIAVGSLIGLFLGTSIVNLPLGLLVAALGLNDWMALNRMPTNRVVDTVASPIEEEVDETEGYPVLSDSFVAVPAHEPPSASTSVNFEQVTVDGVVDVTSTVLRAVNSLVFIGGQRCGKSYLMAVSSQQGLKAGKFKGVCAISAMSIPGEDEHYWQHCIHQYHCDLSRVSNREREYLKYLKVVMAFQREASKENPLLLMIDEFAFLSECLTKDVKTGMQTAIDLQDQLTGLISALSSGGAKTGRFIWVATPKGKIGAMGECGKFMKSLTLVFAAIQEGEYVNSNGLEVGWDEGIFQDTKRNFPDLRKPEGVEKYELGTRIVFVGNRWYDQTTKSLDPTLRGVVIATPPKTTTPAALERPSKQTAADKQQIDAAMVQALRNTAHHTLWEFVRDELGSEDTEEIKAALEAIANLIFDNGLGTLKDKFRLQSKYDVRYSYAGYSKKVAQTHRYTGNICSCCHKEQSKEAHHSHYLGVDDEPGINLFPLCLSCHKLAHGSENWIKDGIWASRNTAEFEARLRLDYQYAISEEGA